jgi:hypothetical protein
VTKTSKRTAASRKRSPRRPAPSRKRAPVRAAPARRAASAKQSPERALAAFATLASREGLRWYLFGAQAVNVHGFPRATADLDITVDLDRHSPATLVAWLRKAGFEPRFVDDAFVAATRVIPVVHRDSSMPINVVLAGPGLEQIFLDEVVQHRIGRRTVPVLSIENLIVTKLLAGRPKDLEDVRELLALRGDSVDHARVDELLAQLEDALGQSDLRPKYRALRKA